MEFNKEDQKWILAARKDLEVDQIAKILGVKVIDVEFFLENSLARLPKAKKIYAKRKQDFNKLICKRFIKDQIQKGLTQKESAEELGLTIHQLNWILRNKSLSWIELKKEASNDLKSKVFYCKCTKCKITKHNSQFFAQKNTKTGFSSLCRNCNKEACKERYVTLKILSKV